MQAQERRSRAAAAALKAPVAEIEARIAQLHRRARAAAEKELARAQGEDGGVAPATTSPARAVDVKGAKVLAATLDGADVKTLRETIDKLKDKLKSAAIVLGSVDGRQGDADRGRDRGPHRAR